MQNKDFVMKGYLPWLSAAMVLLINSCSNSQPASSETKTSLSAVEFAERVNADPAAVVLDVRTSEEFAGGHVEKALNIDWTGDEFQNLVVHIDKSTPVYVYCKSGSRSAAAARSMRADGYEQVYEMQGGIMQWNANDLPLVSKRVSAASGMSRAEFDEITTSDKIVLVDFFAEWCAPCKKMEPYLAEIARDMESEVEVVRINVDQHPGLCKELGVASLPVVQIYRNGEKTWEHKGFIDKPGVVAELKR